jgi:hypothetical protein
MAEPVVGADDQWALTPDGHALVMNKHRTNRLGFAILLAFFRDRGRFPRDESEIEPQGWPQRWEWSGAQPSLKTNRVARGCPLSKSLRAGANVTGVQCAGCGTQGCVCPLTRRRAGASTAAVTAGSWSWLDSPRI